MSPPISVRDGGIVVAADVDSVDKLNVLVDIASSFTRIVGIKIGISLALRFGLAQVVKLIRQSRKVLHLTYDHQKAGTDIPAMGPVFAKTCRDAGVDAFIIFPHSGPETLKAFVTASLQHDIEPIVGLVMTHPAFLQSDGGFISESAPERICKDSIALGVSSFVLPGNKPRTLEFFCNGALKPVQPARIYMPGIGTQGGEISSALNSIGSHIPYPIVGSAIYNSEKPKAVARQFVDQLEKELQKLNDRERE